MLRREGLLAVIILTVASGPTATTPARAAGEGQLRVTTNPAVPAAILVDGIPRADWGLDFLTIESGDHDVCFSDVPGFVTPSCRTVTVAANDTATTEGSFDRLGLLKVEVNPAGLPSTVFVDGTPRNEYGLYTYMEAGDHRVCWGDVEGFAAPDCVDVTLNAGSVGTLTGSFIADPAPDPGPAPDLGEFGYLRVTTEPPLPSRIAVDGIPRSDFGLTWMKIPVGSHSICFSGVPGFEPPLCESTDVEKGAVSTVKGQFAQLGLMRVGVEPAGLPVSVVVDDVARNQFGLYAFIEPGQHSVCGTSVEGWSTPACVDVEVPPGQTASAILVYDEGGVTSGCGLDDAAFCEDFEGPRNDVGNRNGDLSPERFSAARWRSELGSQPNRVEPSRVSSCRPGISANPLPPNDSLICDPTSTVESRHALTATASQNYGDNSYRIAQQMDIAGRTGTVRFDASLENDGLLGFTTFAFIDEPYNAPSYLADNSAGPTPRQGIQIHFNARCPGPSGWTLFPRVRIYDRHRETVVDDDSGRDGWCTSAITTQPDHLNRVEISLSESYIEIAISDASSNGVDFSPLKTVFSAPLALNFTRGNLYFGSHNHATEKYAGIPSWNVRWDNFGFDGPKLTPQRVHQVDDAAESSGSGLNLGYPLPNGSGGGSTPPLTVTDVSTDSISSARLVFDMAADPISNQSWGTWRVNYSLNGRTWHSVGFSNDELDLFDRAGSYIFSVAIDPNELVPGTNTIRFSGSGFYTGYQPYIGNIDLVLE